MSARISAATRVGDRLGPLRLPPISRLTLALYCGASNDHYAIHVDSDYARSVGLDDVIGHGMLSMAYVGRLLAAWSPQTLLRSFSCRFVDATRPGDVPVLEGEVVELVEHRAERCARVSLTLSDAEGRQKARAEAVVALPR